jgi:hypothetical protein
VGAFLPGARVPKRRCRATVFSTETATPAAAPAPAAAARYQPENSLAARGFVTVETVLPMAALQRPVHHKINVGNRFPGARVQYRRVSARARVLVVFDPDADQLGIGEHFLTFRRGGGGWRVGWHGLWHGKGGVALTEIAQELLLGLLLFHRGSAMELDFLCQFLLLPQ